MRNAHSIASLKARRPLFRKAITFAAIGVVNVGVDSTVFFLILAAIGGRGTAALVGANLFAWLFAATGSYVMNSYITFAAESGRQLSLRAYVTFLASGVLGLLANTATLLLTALVLPLWAAKGCAILVAFVVNFCMSNFVVFRARPSLGIAPKE